MTRTQLPRATDEVLKLLRMRGPFTPAQLPAQIRRACAEVAVKLSLGAWTEHALRARVQLFLDALLIEAHPERISHLSPDSATAPTAQQAPVRDGEKHGTTTATETVRS